MLDFILIVNFFPSEVGLYGYRNIIMYIDYRLTIAL